MSYLLQLPGSERNAGPVCGGGSWGTFCAELIMNTEARVEVGVVGGGVVLQSGWTFVSKSVYNRGTGPNLGTLMLCSYTTLESVHGTVQHVYLRVPLLSKRF
eukprot:COSAG02_NODE_11980_length_1620_cov_4.507561_2_plen_102_part_00